MEGEARAKLGSHGAHGGRRPIPAEAWRDALQHQVGLPAFLADILKRLAECGWVEVWLAADGRGQLLTLSEDGQALLEAALPAWERAQDRAAALLGEPLREALAAVPLAPLSLD